eukprot:RCo015582
MNPQTAQEGERVPSNRSGAREREQTLVQAHGLTDLAEQDLVEQVVGQGKSPRAPDLASLRSGQADGLCEDSDLLLQALGLLGFLLHRLHHLFPDSGHAQEDRGPDLLQGVHQGALQGVRAGKANGDVVRQVGRSHNGHHDVQHLSCDVRERQVGDHSLVPLAAQEGHQLQYGLHHEGQVVVRHHNGLGVSRGPTGVDQAAALPRRDASNDRVHLGVIHGARSGLRHKLRPGAQGDGAGAPYGVGQGVVVDHDLLHQRELRLHLDDLVQLLPVLQNNGVGLAVGDDVLAGLGAVGGVDSDALPARGDASKEGHEPLWAVEAQDGDGLVPLEAQRKQAPGKGVDVLAVLRPGHGLPLPVPLHPNRGKLTLQVRGALQELDDVRVLLAGHSHRGQGRLDGLLGVSDEDLAVTAILREGVRVHWGARSG